MAFLTPCPQCGGQSLNDTLCKECQEKRDKKEREEFRAKVKKEMEGKDIEEILLDIQVDLWLLNDRMTSVERLMGSMAPFG